MRTPRVLGLQSQESNFYHCMFRMLGELPFWTDVEKEKMRQLLAQMVAFSGARLVSFCIMGNHVHALLEIFTDRGSLREMSDEAFLDHLEILYSPDLVQRIGWQLESFRQSGLDDQAEQLRERYFARMHDLSALMRELKQRFAQWYNKRHQRGGPVWRDRFKSVLVEDDQNALRTMAAYIDLNPVRAGLVSDPKDYRWSGYAEAVSGVESSRQGLAQLIRGEVGDDASTATWQQVSAIYRCWLYQEGEERRNDSGSVVERGLASDQVEEELARQGQLAQRVLVKMRIRYFSQGVAIGSKAFLEEIFRNRREHFSPRRLDGARKMRGVDFGGLMNMRDLRKSSS